LQVTAAGLFLCRFVQTFHQQVIPVTFYFTGITLPGGSAAVSVGVTQLLRIYKQNAGSAVYNCMWKKLLVSMAIPLAVGAVASWATIPAIAGWYAGLNKPSFNPPNYLFGPVWTTLYALMGIALFLVWKSDATAALKQKAIVLFAVQLTLNFFWSIIFFNAHQPGWALVEIMAMWLFILLTIFAFGRISSLAAWLLVPYICWVSFAAVLNFAIWRLN
jgi:translocator protein